MPPELLSRIFARDSKPISGHLLAYTRVERYRKIRITSNKKLQALCDLIAMNADLGGLVQTLVIRLGNDGMAMNGDMRALYQSLDKLESLEVSGRLVDLILSHDVASTCFPRLERLELDHPFQQHENSLEPVRFSCIEHYRELAFLKVTICCYGSTTEGGIQVVSESAGELGRDDEGEGEVEEYQGGDEDESEVGSDGSRERESMTQHVGQWLGERLAAAALGAGPSVGSTSKDSEDDFQGTILELHLTAPAVDIRTLDFVERFGSLVGLTLTNSAHYTSDFTPFLSLYNRASSLERVSLTSNPIDFTPANDVSVALQRFTALKSLVLNTPNFSSTLFQHLCDPFPSPASPSGLSKHQS